jgi:hypothetical protein
MWRFKKIYSIVSLLIICVAAHKTFAQQRGIYDTVKVHGCIEANGDTIPCSYLPFVYVFGKLTPQQRRYQAEWTRLRNAVYVTYPYAVKASIIINQINAQLAGVTDKGKRKAIIRSREKDMKTQFADKVTALSVYQGKVLMKLIYRQTGNNCYEIIDEYKGSFNAALWQTVAVIFGSSLKQNYDPNGDDRAMESIVLDVERMYGVRG